jgi:hypothetical protein
MGTSDSDSAQSSATYVTGLYREITLQARYRGHCLSVEILPSCESAVCIRVTDSTGWNWPSYTLEAALGHDLTCRAALERGLRMIDEACRERLAFPWDENQPNY